MPNSAERLLSDADVLPLDFIVRVMFAVHEIPSSTHTLQKFSCHYDDPDRLADAFIHMLVEKNDNYSFKDLPFSVRLGLADNDKASSQLLSKLVRSYRSGHDTLSLLTRLMRNHNMDCTPKFRET